MSDNSQGQNLVRSILQCDCDGLYHVPFCFYYDEWLDAVVAQDEPFPTEMGPSSGSYGSVTQTSIFKHSSQCHHNMSPLTLPSGMVVTASAWRDVPYERTAPDVGVYLDPCWFPADTFAYALGWTDFGLPTVSDANVVRIGHAVLDHLRYDEVVEVGCIGSHGRTGTFLALLVIMDSEGSYGAKRAIRYVRDNHCESAIETKGQERWLSRISGKLRRGDI